MSTATAMIPQRWRSWNCSVDFITELKNRNKKPMEVPIYHAQPKCKEGRRGEPFRAPQAIPTAVIHIDNPTANKRSLCVTEYLRKAYIPVHRQSMLKINKRILVRVETFMVYSILSSQILTFFSCKKVYISSKNCELSIAFPLGSCSRMCFCLSRNRKAELSSC